MRGPRPSSIQHSPGTAAASSLSPSPFSSLVYEYEYPDGPTVRQRLLPTTAATTFIIGHSEDNDPPRLEGRDDNDNDNDNENDEARREKDKREGEDRDEREFEFELHEARHRIVVGEEERDQDQLQEQDERGPTETLGSIVVSGDEREDCDDNESEFEFESESEFEFESDNRNDDNGNNNDDYCDDDEEFEAIRYRLLREEEDEQREWLESIFARDSDVFGDDSSNSDLWEFLDEQMRLFQETYPEDDNGSSNNNNNNINNNNNNNNNINYEEEGDYSNGNSSNDNENIHTHNHPHTDNSSDNEDLWWFPNDLLREEERPQMAALAEACDSRDEESAPDARCNGTVIHRNNSSAGAANAVASRCVVCLEAFATHALVPCGHLCLCGECAVRSLAPSTNAAAAAATATATATVPSCPVCRQPPSMVLRIFVP